jgi:hypothetical protein
MNHTDKKLGDNMSETITEQTKGSSRRQMLTRAGFLGAAALGSGMLNFSKQSEADGALGVTFPLDNRGRKFRVNDYDILNFALNLEYLEAEYYQRAAFGTPLSAADTGLNATNVVGGTQVPFAIPAVQQYANEIAADELNHVRFLRSALGKKAVVEPAINFTDTFTALAIGAGVIQAGQTFDPFANDLNFLLGSFVFEDVGVTAYNGAAPFISKSAYLTAAAGILAVEAYHAAEIRTLIFQQGSAAVTIANQISAFRDAASNAVMVAGAVQNTDQGVNNSDGTANIVPTDANSLAFARTFGQVLNIVYGSTATVTANTSPNVGGFFPNGLNGRIK